MNTLLEHSAQMPYPTDLRLVFEALGGRQCEFDWLITDLEFIHLRRESAPAPPVVLHDAQWLSGAELTRIVGTHELQLVWAVLSGFPAGTPLAGDDLGVYPVAESNPGWWSGTPSIQLPRAELEIVCFDSSCTVLLSRDFDLTRRFRAFFPEAVDLDDHNRRSQPGA